MSCKQRIFVLFLLNLFIAKIATESTPIDFSQEFHPDPIEYTRCSPYYCSNKRFMCEPVKCSKDQKEATAPELCICCPKCFNKIEKGGACGDDQDTICNDGLKCVDKKCVE
ncbi:unnamed protein product [Phyllotreta striolata]|uniref:Uncharacterized protein n=1 Tax=Phyllotreta striolata TaxID=444603 RepID=A0A9N9TRA8_PHYSR|nr:unnamed protein product [Phyllotreta striolata]